MEKELKRLVVEILSLVLLLIIVIPICVEASSNYRVKKESLYAGNQTSVDINNRGEFKEVNVITNKDKPISVNLILKISKFSDDYYIHLDDNVYDIKDLDYTEDENYQYYRLGIYEVTKSRKFQFKLAVKGKSYYDETISYSFFTEGLL